MEQKTYSVEAIELGQLVEFNHEVKLQPVTSVKIFPFCTKEIFPEKIDQWKNIKTLFTTPYCGKTEDAGAVFQKGDEYAYVFRGTKRFEEWFHNFRFFLDESGRHIGYTDLLKSINENDLPQKFLPNGWNKLMICGCSLGGALATLLALEMTQNVDIKNKEIRLITFGAPRCIDARNSQILNSTLTEWKPYERETDFVPTIFSVWTGGNILGKQIILPSYGFNNISYPLNHAMQFYHKGVCEKENVKFDPIIKYTTFSKNIDKFVNPF